MQRLRVAMCQINPTVGDIAGNTELILEAMAQAEAQGAQLAVFGELAVCGYPPEDLLLRPSFVADCQAAMEQIAASSGRCVSIVGTVEADADAMNTAVVVANGQRHATYHKRLLPNYSVFDEGRYFTPGPPAPDGADFGLIDVGGAKIGITICEDIWAADGPLFRQATGGADVIAVLNASPYHIGKVHERDQLLMNRALDASCAVVYVNTVGGQDELIFDGASVAVDQHGEILARAPQFRSELTLVDIDVVPRFRKRLLDPRQMPTVPAPLPVTVIDAADAPSGLEPPLRSITSPLDPHAELWEALVTATRDYVTKSGFTEVGVALSGGIDSAIVATIAADAIGADRVHCVLMPSRYSSDHSVIDAIELCERQGMPHRTIDIEPGHAAFDSMLAESFTGLEADTTEENLQSRLRGITMMALSNKFGWLVLTTGNKSEAAVGYSTLYGDTAGAFAVIKDVYKTAVYDLCHWRNESGEVIPINILTKPPSAELRPDQRDDQSLPAYDILDPILQGYVEQDLSIKQQVALGFDSSVVTRIRRLVDTAEFKRRQSPLGPKVTPRAFGRDRRMPIINRYRG